MDALAPLTELLRVVRARRDQMLEICSSDDGRLAPDFIAAQAAALMCDAILLDITVQIDCIADQQRRAA